MFQFRTVRLHLFCAFALFIAMAATGCGLDGLRGPLPDAIAGFTLSDLGEIQDDSRLSDDEKREQIREAVGAPDDEDGDRLVEFLLTLTVP